MLLTQHDFDEAARLTGRIANERRRATSIARVALAAGDAKRAGEALDRAGAGTTLRHRLDTTILLARLDQRLGRIDQAQGHVDRAVAMAADAGWVRPFLEDGPQLAPFIRAPLSDLPTSAFTLVLLDELRDADDVELHRSRAASASARQPYCGCSRAS